MVEPNTGSWSRMASSLRLLVFSWLLTLTAKCSNWTKVGILLALRACSKTPTNNIQWWHSCDSHSLFGRDANTPAHLSQLAPACNMMSWIQDRVYSFQWQLTSDAHILDQHSNFRDYMATSRARKLIQPTQTNAMPRFNCICQNAFLEMNRDFVERTSSPEFRSLDARKCHTASPGLPVNLSAKTSSAWHAPCHRHVNHWKQNSIFSQSNSCSKPQQACTAVASSFKYDRSPKVRAYLLERTQYFVQIQERNHPNCARYSILLLTPVIKTKGNQNPES